MDTSNTGSFAQAFLRKMENLLVILVLEKMIIFSIKVNEIKIIL